MANCQKSLLPDLSSPKIPPIAKATARDANVDFKSMNAEEIENAIWKKAIASYESKEKLAGAESLRAYERYIMLNIIDSQWKDHLLSIDQVKQGIGLVGYGQKDPLVEYKKQSFDMFQDMLDRIDTNTRHFTKFVGAL